MCGANSLSTFGVGRRLPAGAIRLAGKEAALSRKIGEPGDGRAESGGFKRLRSGHGPGSRAVRNPVIPACEFGRTDRPRFNDATAIFEVNSLACREFLRTRALNAERAAAHGRECHAVGVAGHAEEGHLRIVGDEVVRRRSQNESFARNIRMHMQRDRAGEQCEVGVRNAGRGTKVVDREYRVGGDIECGSVFELDFGAPIAGNQTIAGFERHICRSRFPGHVFAMFIAASLDPHIAVGKTDAGDLRIDSVGVVLAHDEERALLELFRGIAIENLVDLL